MLSAVIETNGVKANNFDEESNAVWILFICFDINFILEKIIINLSKIVLLEIIIIPTIKNAPIINAIFFP